MRKHDDDDDDDNVTVVGGDGDGNGRCGRTAVILRRFTGLVDAVPILREAMEEVIDPSLVERSMVCLTLDRKSVV